MTQNKIDVKSETIIDLFQKASKEHNFLIPEYQRPYSWGEEQTEQLFTDLWEFYKKIIEDPNSKEKYFLGSIVFFENEDGKWEIIDGQQRITTIFLLLRAILKKCENTNSANTKNLAMDIEKCIWNISNDYTKEIDKNSMSIQNFSVMQSNLEDFENIIKSGEYNKKSKSNYSKNYAKLIELIEEKAKNEIEGIFNFFNTILEKTLIFNVSSQSQESAMTVFETLNNRGIPLSDADIFKAKIYNLLKDKEKKDIFIEKWKELESDCVSMNKTLNDVFSYYMFYLRAQAGDTDTTTPGLRKYILKYLEQNNIEDIFDKMMENIKNIISFLKMLNNLNEEKDLNLKIRQQLDIIFSFSNDFGKYPALIYYLQNKEKIYNDDTSEYLDLLIKLRNRIVTRYLLIPSINDIKHGILLLNKSIIKGHEFDFSKLEKKDSNDVMEKIKSPNVKIISMIIKMFEYSQSDQEEIDILPAKWEIEHILPKSHAQFDEENKELYEQIGNKIPLDKRSNIKASDNWFKLKKEEYKKATKFRSAIKISQLKNDYWTINDIKNRNNELVQRFKEITKD
ncbi:DUF262 domain-containing protein [Metamycoplasma spumans]|uniref:DUF262 domain-containing protein n=1 Tax=Metamycoplasma spumans TaxID=92406 RepID=UPI0034DCE79B